MSPLLIAALSALAFGVSDFVGGLRSRSTHFVWVSLVSQLVVTAGVVVWVVAFRPGTPTLTGLAWGALAGVGQVLGTLMLMRGLAAGAMHVAGPLAAVVGAALPVLVGVLSGERPGPIAWVGVVAALPAVWLVAAGGATEAPDVAGGPGVAAGPGATPTGPTAPPGAQRLLPPGGRDGILAGLGFALFYVAIARAGESSGGWPLVFLEVTALIIMTAVAAWLRPPGRLRDASGAWLMGTLALMGTVLYFVAVHAGMLSLVVVVASLYPAFTVLLAVLVLREKPSGRQVVGLLLAAASVALIAAAGS